MSKSSLSLQILGVMFRYLYGKLLIGVYDKYFQASSVDTWRWWFCVAGGIFTELWGGGVGLVDCSFVYLLNATVKTVK